MERVFTICMIVGFTIPLLSLILGQIGDILDNLFDGVFNLFEGLSLHTHFEVGNLELYLLPFSMQSLCGGLLIFGAVGKLLIRKTNQTVCIIVAVLFGYLIAVLLQTMIQKLKHVENTTYSKEQLLLFDAKIINAIIPGGFGCVSVTTLDGITTSYPAKATIAEGIPQDTKVKILYFEKNIAIVEKVEET
ncbi:hypothetical protein [Anaerosporobacter faecicola]|uniref:hypothetical protein n=1 Tax=Anaerosporobacter faecicola TaxID=2718714 RepID=UPI00143B2342|nr:hypothetical protein [Anaerosporobacter faecicola]